MNSQSNGMRFDTSEISHSLQERILTELCGQFVRTTVCHEDQQTSMRMYDKIVLWCWVRVGCEEKERMKTSRERRGRGKREEQS